MDYDFRMSIFEQLHPEVKKTSLLPTLKREYSLNEIAMMTRWGPAQALGLNEHYGRLQTGAFGDIVVYRNDRNPQAMFAIPEKVFRRGRLVYQNGSFMESYCPKVRHEATPKFDPSIVKSLKRVWDDYYTVSLEAQCKSME